MGRLMTERSCFLVAPAAGCTAVAESDTGRGWSLLDEPRASRVPRPGDGRLVHVHLSGDLADPCWRAST